MNKKELLIGIGAIILGLAPIIFMIIELTKLGG